MNGETMKSMVRLGLVDDIEGEEVDGSTFVNLTHSRIILILNNKRFVRLEPAGQLRVNGISSLPEQHELGFNTIKRDLVVVGDLPRAKKGIILIVPEGIASLKKRKDMFAPVYSGKVDRTGALIVEHLIRFK